MGKVVTLIDADGLCYLGKNDDTLQQVLDKVNFKINAILEETKADYYALFISKGPYFRHNISSEYKSKRQYNVQKWVYLIKEYLIAEWEAQFMKGVEADDLVTYIYNTKNSFELPEENEYKFIIAAVDKDLLKAIPGMHLNYNKKVAPDVWNMVWQETLKEDARLFRLRQLIVGDTADGISGLHGKGEKYWDKIVEAGNANIYKILEEYITAYGESLGIYAFQVNYRLLHMLEDAPDFMKEVGCLPNVVFRETVNNKLEDNPF
jgi:5'-3' exonuclease